MAILSVYQPRDRKAPPLWQIFNRCYQAFEDVYEEKFEKRFGFFSGRHPQAFPLSVKETRCLRRVGSCFSQIRGSETGVCPNPLP